VAASPSSRRGDRHQPGTRRYSGKATGAASTLTIRHPDFLDREKDLHVGVFGANTASDVRKTLLIREIYVTVRTKVGAMAR
jgi:hypothetical protein